MPTRPPKSATNCRDSGSQPKPRLAIYCTVLRLLSIHAVGDRLITVGINRKYVREPGDLKDLVDVVI